MALDDTLFLGPDVIFVGGLPCNYTEAQVREMLQCFGALRGFDLVKEGENGNSAFCVYHDSSVADVVCAALNGIQIGAHNTLTVTRANQTQNMFPSATGQFGDLPVTPVQTMTRQLLSEILANNAIQANPNLNLAAVGLNSGSAGALEGPDCIYVGELPGHFTETQVRRLLESFGALRAFDLVKDIETGNAAFCVYQDPSVTDIACVALNGIKMGDKTLTVRRANQYEIGLQLQRLTLQPPTKVVSLTQVLTEEDLIKDEDYEEILEDMEIEGGKFGRLVNVVIPRPNPNGEFVAGVGKVFLEYADIESSTKARAGLNGRKFGGKQVLASFYPEDKFNQGEYDG